MSSRGGRSSPRTFGAWSTRQAARRSSTSLRGTTTTACRPGTVTPPTSPGAIGVSTDAQASWWGGSGIGTVPHALIAAYGGDTVLAATISRTWAPDDMNVVVLVDFENDSVRTALEVARALAPRLWACGSTPRPSRRPLALDELGDFDPRGVNERLVRKVRDALDAEGFGDVRIVVSGGFGVDKIRAFEERGVPVDVYGVGSSLMRGSNDFTADIVLLDGRPVGKVGRRLRPNARLERVT